MRTAGQSQRPPSNAKITRGLPSAVVSSEAASTREPCWWKKAMRLQDVSATEVPIPTGALPETPGAGGAGGQAAQQRAQRGGWAVLLHRGVDARGGQPQLARPPQQLPRRRPLRRAPRV
eukprot:COSAG04_NODE_21219_length_378_cov_0.551971_1_plen_118_part_01